ncbi:MAG: dipeptidase [Gammaproteobacteria bacterium]|nr:dipeptidase [Gammaproteobacteria bacterium]
MSTNKPTAILIVFFLLLISTPAVSANLPRSEINQILTSFRTSTLVNFNDLLTQLLDSSVISSETRDSVRRYLAEDTLDADQSSRLYRLLGIYSRLRYGEDALETLRQLVAIPTYRVETIPQHENPEFHRFATALAMLASQYGLEFRNVDHRVYEITVPGSDSGLIGFHAHADVVPVNPELWGLEDGTRLDPFEVTQVEGRLYGRGTEDDKNGIVAALYALRVIKEENLVPLRTLRLLVDTTEETTGEAIPYYFESNPIPDYNIALDGSYPVVIAEKGFGTVMATFPVRSGSGEGAEIVTLTGGLATNQIPSASVATILSRQPAELAREISEAGRLYEASHGSNFRIDVNSERNSVVLTVQGVSAHSSEPESGVNPVSRMLDFLYTLQQQQLFQSNHFTDAASYAAENWGLDYYGNGLDLAYADSFMGPLTASLTFVNVDSNSLRLAVNLRLPVGREPEALLADIDTRLQNWVDGSNVEVAFDLSAAEPMYRNPEGAWVNALLDVATENLDMPREFGSSAGATSIHDLPNGVQFGLALPTEKYTGHNANEYKTIDQFLLDLQIVTETMARLGSMPQL